MKPVVIAGLWAETSLGDLEETWQGLLVGRSGLLRGSFPDYEYPLGMITTPATVANSPVGSADRLQRLLKKVLDVLPILPSSSALFVATTKGGGDEVLRQSSPPWAGQPWDLGVWVAHYLGFEQPGIVVSAACASGTLAMIRAIQEIQAKRHLVVLAVGVDLVSRFVVTGFSSLQALSMQPCRPFSRDRQGLSLGEGVGVALLTTEETARKSGWPVLARLTGYGMACDAVHITAPCRQASGLLATLLQTVGHQPERVGGIHAHGTGTRRNDAMELTGFETFFTSGLPPIYGTKGSIGHTLGAAGVIETAISVISLRESLLPGTTGAENPETEAISMEPTPLRKPVILSCNSGFGGINAAILMERA